MTFDDREWLEADGRGGFASGTVSGVRTRRYPALLLTATTPPTGRVVLLNGFDAWVDTPAGTFPLSTQRYTPDVCYPDARHSRVVHARPVAHVEVSPAGRHVHPAGDPGAPAHFGDNRPLDGCSIRRRSRAPCAPLPLRTGLPLDASRERSVRVRSGAMRARAPLFAIRRRSVSHDRQRRRVRARARLVSKLSLRGGTGARARCDRRPGVAGRAALGDDRRSMRHHVALRGTHRWLERRHARGRSNGGRCRQRRGACPSCRIPDFPRSRSRQLPRCAERRTHRRCRLSMVHGLGTRHVHRDTGLCLATGRYVDARDILLEWAGTVSEGMLPNRFPDSGETRVGRVRPRARVVRTEVLERAAAVPVRRRRCRSPTGRDGRDDPSKSDPGSGRAACAAGRSRPIARRRGDRGARAADPLGLRSLARSEPGYSSRYEGGPSQRDAVYHQGTVWPWLIGPFVEAWLRARGNTASARSEARLRFLTPVLAHLAEAGLGHVSEIADAEPPFRPRGCPFQAWSLGELLRLDRQVLAAPRRVRHRRTLQSA
jgi:hypothetical protein